MSEWLKVIILGIVQGLTEFLPISSTGHLIVASALLNFGGSLGGTFEIFIQLGTVFSVLTFYHREIWQQMRAVPSDRSAQRFWLAIAIAFVPAALIGAVFSDQIKTVLFSPLVVAAALIAGGVVFLAIERRPVPQRETPEAAAVALRQAVGIGVAQMFALVPGVSRSGATIVGGLLAGLSRRAATQFSFYLAIPTLGGATLYDLWKSRDLISSDDLAMLLVGAVVSGVVGWLAVGWLLRFVANNTFVVFGYYRIAAGILIALLVLAGLPV
ncbi:MAG: undecaprenyl-diphosphate phosphatase [Aggregatilineales bacterium]